MPYREWVICAIFRDEAAYLAEWVEFHLMMGASHLYLYQNRSVDEWERVLRPYVEEGVVTVAPWEHDPPCQLEAYADFISRHRGEPIWAAFIDIDEFLFSPTDDRVTDVLNREPFCDYGAFGVNWMMFGAGGRKTKGDGLVTERFVHRPPPGSEVNAHIKTIGRLDSIEGPITSHVFSCRDGTFGEAGNHIVDSFSLPPAHRVLRINHYHTKSWEEWLRRVSHSRVDINAKRDPGEFDRYQEPAEEDRAIQRFLPELKRRLEERKNRQRQKEGDPKVGVVIGHYNMPGVLALQIACIRKTCGNIPILISDDASDGFGLGEADSPYCRVARLCEENQGVFLWPNVQRIGHAGGDMSAFWKAIIWGGATGLQVVYKLSQRYIIDIHRWAQDGAELLLESGLATLGRGCAFHHWEIRTEAVGLRIDRWHRPDILAHLTPRRIAWPMEQVLWDDIRDRLEGKLCEWPIMSAARPFAAPGILFREANRPVDYENLAARLGVSLEYVDCASSTDLPNYVVG